MFERSIYEFRKVYEKDFVIVPATTSLADAAKVMLDRHVGDVICKTKMESAEVQEGVIGIVTDRDLVLEFAKGQLDPSVKCR